MLVVATPALLLAGCAQPPQVLAISPPRGAVGVSSHAAIEVRFDRPMDETSVAAHFRLVPAAQGVVRWPNSRQLVFEHAPLRPSHKYTVVLEPGYRDARGVTNQLRHSWSFQTEGPPSLTTLTPASGTMNVDPTTSVSLTFSRPMDLTSLSRALSLVPAVPFQLRRDSADQRRVLLIPETLLQPRQTYRLLVGEGARDVDGNRLTAAVDASFTTGPLHGLQQWVGFIAQPAPGAGAGSAGGVWIVDGNRLPRRLVDAPVTSFSWSADGSRLLLQAPGDEWTDQALEGTPVPLPFHATWASYLAPGHGYAYLDAGHLRLLAPDGTVTEVAAGVTAAAVAPDGTTLAFVVPVPASSPPTPSQQTAARYEIRGYEVDLRTQYDLQDEPRPVDGLTWAPDGNSIAYRVRGQDPDGDQIRVRLLHGPETSLTVASGRLSTPSWQADSRSILFTATLPARGSPVTRPFRLTVGDRSTAPLTANLALPTPPGLHVSDLSPSPDGHQIAFLGEVAGSSQVWIMNADGSDPVQLTRFDRVTFPYSAARVTWTPS
jgi:hypothetical protein